MYLRAIEATLKDMIPGHIKALVEFAGGPPPVAASPSVVKKRK